MKDGRIESPANTPFSWRGALYVVDSIARVLAKDHKPRLDDFREKLSGPGWIADALDRTDAEIAKWLTSPAMRKAEEATSDAERLRLEPARNPAGSVDGSHEAAWIFGAEPRADTQRSPADIAAAHAEHVAGDPTADHRPELTLNSPDTDQGREMQRFLIAAGAMKDTPGNRDGVSGPGLSRC